MEKRIVGRCPVCGKKMVVTELKCKECGTSVRGEFGISPFLKLSAREEKFILLFLKFRGSLTEVGRELGISYPTVRNRLEDILAKLGIRELSSSRVSEILDMLERGEITAEEAIKLIEEKK